MAKIQRIKPIQQSMIRIELDITPDELTIASHFDPKCTTVRDKESNTSIFILERKGGNQVGKHGIGLYLNSIPQNEKIITNITLSSSMSEAELIATITNANEHLNTIEKQVKETLKQFNEAKTKIEEV